MDVTAAEADPEMSVIRLLPHRGYVVFHPRHPLLAVNPPQQAAETWSYPFVATARFAPAMFKGLAGAILGSEKSNRRGKKSLHAVTCESLHMMKTIVLESDALAILPLNVIADEVERGELVARPCPDWVRANFGIARLAHRSLSPLGERFVRMVREADAELLEWEEKTAAKLFPRQDANRRRRAR